MSVLSLEAVGLVSCIIGAAIFLRAFAFATFVHVSEDTYAQSVKSVFDTLCAQRLDARFGAPLLMLGFGLQLLSTLGVREKPVVMFLMLAAVCIAVLYYSLMRDLIATEASRAIVREREAVRENPKLIEAKIEAPISAPHFSVVESMAGA